MPFKNPWPEDLNYTRTSRMIACPDCPERPGCNIHSPNPEIPEPCPTCAGYGDILHPDEVEESRKKAIKRAEFLKDLKPWPEYIEGRWSA